MTRRLYIGNLPWSVSDARLREVFSGCGAVKDAKVVTDRETGRSRGFGFVEFESEESAQEAKSLWNGNNLDGRNLVINDAAERPKRPNQNKYEGNNNYRNVAPIYGAPPADVGISNDSKDSGNRNKRNRRDRFNRGNDCDD